LRVSWARACWGSRTRPTTRPSASRPTKGMLTLRSDAESCFLEAIGIAQRQRAKSLELRAATSLGRLWANTGKVSEAHALLSAIYDGFTEGFDTADLREAKSLLEHLARRARRSGADEAGLKG
jgi:hypothetical protein